MSTFDFLPYVVVALWLSPTVLAVVWFVLCVRRERRDARLRAVFVAAGGSPERAAALLTLVRDEAS